MGENGVTLTEAQMQAIEDALAAAREEEGSPDKRWGGKQVEDLHKASGLELK